jgi:hypothetical protein
MRRLTPLLALAAVLVITAPAAAKEILSVQACGPDRCVTTEDEEVRAALMNGGAPSKPPGGEARSHLLRARVGDPRTGEEFGTFVSAWVPRWHMLVGEDGTWMRVPARAERAFERVTRGLVTFPPSELGRLAQSEIDLPTAAPPPRPRSAPAPTRDDPGGDGMWWLLLAAGIALGLGGALLLLRRRGSDVPRPATP